MGGGVLRLQSLYTPFTAKWISKCLNPTTLVSNSKGINHLLSLLHGPSSGCLRPSYVPCFLCKVVCAKLLKINPFPITKTLDKPAFNILYVQSS